MSLFQLAETLEHEPDQRLVGRYVLTRDAAASFLGDHQVEERAVLPAVFGMALLEQAAARLLKRDLPTRYRDLEFRRFLPIPEAGVEVELFAEAARNEAGGIELCLYTELRSESFRRRLEHLTAVVEESTSPAAHLPSPAECLVLAEPTIGLAREQVHPHVVPFGPAFWNIHEVLQLSVSGAVGRLVPPDLPGGAMRWVRDAAYQLASVWAQRYTGHTAVPVAVARETRLGELDPGEACLCRIVPHEQPPDSEPVADAFLFGADGRILEVLEGLRSADVTRGRRTPPAWHVDRNDEIALEELLAMLPARLQLIDLRAPVSLVDELLTPDEERRRAQLGERRLPGWRAVRLALKSLGREAARGQGVAVGLARIQTLSAEDPRRPTCMLRSGDALQILAPVVSVSHDLAYGLAGLDVAGEPLGVDVERVEERAERVAEMFLADEERSVVRSGAGQSDAERFTRAWSAKEAVAKARREPLSVARRKVLLRVLEDEGADLEDIEGGSWRVTQVLYRGHVVSVARVAGGQVA